MFASSSSINRQRNSSAAANASARSPALDAGRDPRDFLARRPMLEPQRKRPAAVCTRCDAFSFITSAFDQPCERLHHGRPCAGVLTCTAGHGEWRACEACDGTGWRSGMVCMHCQSLGWRIFRHA